MSALNPLVFYVGIIIGVFLLYLIVKEEIMPLIKSVNRKKKKK